MMADVLSPVKEECVRHGHELNVAEYHNADSCPLGWFDVGVSVFWWSMKPVRYGVQKAAAVHPKTGERLLSKIDPVVDALQANFPSMTDEKSGKVFDQMKTDLMRRTRHTVRSAIRTNAGRGLLQGLDKVISLSESLLDYIESRNDDDGATSPKTSDHGTGVEELSRPDSREDDSAVGSSSECDKSTMTPARLVTSTFTNTKRRRKLAWFWDFLGRPVNVWIDGLKFMRRHLYRVGRLRRCKSARTPAKDIANRPMISPRKRHVGGSFSTMIKYALSPIAGKPKRSNLDDVRGVKAKELRVPLKRKYDQVTPYSYGDDSDNETGRIIDDYFQLQDYDSEEDSDYQWHSSDDYLTSDSEEYRTDSDGEEKLRHEVDDVSKESGQIVQDIQDRSTTNRLDKRTSKSKPRNQNGASDLGAAAEDASNPTAEEAKPSEHQSSDPDADAKTK